MRWPSISSRQRNCFAVIGGGSLIGSGAGLMDNQGLSIDAPNGRPSVEPSNLRAVVVGQYPRVRCLPQQSGEPAMIRLPEVVSVVAPRVQIRRGPIYDCAAAGV